MKKILQALLGGAGGGIGEIMKGIDGLDLGAHERLQLKSEAVKSFVESQTRIIEAEAKAGGLAALWRPIASLSFVALLWWIVVAATFGYPVPDLSRVPGELWAFLMGYGGARTVEKVGALFDKRRKKG